MKSSISDSLYKGVEKIQASVSAVAATDPPTVYGYQTGWGLMKLVQAKHPSQLYLPVVVR